MRHYYAVLVKPADSHPPQSFEVGLKPSDLNSKASFHNGFLHWFLFKQYTFFFFPQLKFRIFKSTFELKLFTEPPGKRSHGMVRTKDTTGAASLWSRYELAAHWKSLSGQGWKRKTYLDRYTHRIGLLLSNAAHLDTAGWDITVYLDCLSETVSEQSVFINFYNMHWGKLKLALQYIKVEWLSLKSLFSPFLQ